MITHTLDLVYNLALLVALSVISGFLRRRGGHPAWGAAAQGLLFGGAAVVGMMRPLALGPGLIFDGRSVMLSLCGLFFGPLAAGIAGGMAALYRLFLGGPGTPMGLLVIASSALLGLAFRRRGTRSARGLLAMGLLVHVAMVLLMLTLPGRTGLEVMRRLALPILLAYPLATLFIGRLLADQEAANRSLEALLESEGRFRSMAENSTDFIIRYDRKLRHAYLNPAALRMLGLEAGDIVGRTHRDFDLPEAVCAFWEERIRRVLETGQPLQTEFQFQGLAGWEVHDSRLIPEFDAAGNIQSVLAVSRDITERKRAQVLLEETLQRLDLAVSSGNLGIWDLDLQTGRLEWNDRMYELYGRSREAEPPSLELWADSLHPEDRAVTYDIYLAALRGERPYDPQFRILRPDGTIRFIQGDGLVNRDAQGAAIRITGLNRDITERKLAEQALLESEEKFRNLTQHLQVGIVVHAPDTSIQLANHEACRLLGLSQDQMMGRVAIDPAWHFLREDGSPLPPEGYPVAQVLATGRDLKHFVGGIHRPGAGDPAWVQVDAYQDVDERGILRYVVVTFVDITERRLVEQERQHLQAQIQQNQKMESLGSLAGGVAHDMNNVLGAVLALASANLEAQPPGSPLRTALETIIKAAERGGRMVKSLLGFARKTKAEERVLRMNEILRDEVRLLERTTLAKVRIEMDLAADLRPILGDESALNHAIMNLCVNAVEAMPPNGTLTLRTRNLAGPWIEVCVEDTGIGMPPEVLARAMDPFFTTKEVGKGTGLGLPLVFSAVKAHHGQMDIQSEPGRGTRVSLRFPALEPARTASTAPETPRDGSAQGAMKVLLVDDDELVQASTRMLLEIMGHPVETVPCGEEALARLEAGEETDLVILDMNMPGLGGLGTLPRLRSLRPDLPVLLATGRADQTALDLVEADSHTILLPKPFSRDEMAVKIQAAQRMRGENRP